MYSIDLRKMTVDEFSENLKSIDLLPGRRILLKKLDQIIPQLKRNGITNLSELQVLLKKKSDYANMAALYSVDEEYLIVLNREVNSYESKLIDIERIEVFTKDEIMALARNDIKTTKDIYIKLQTKSERDEISATTNISEEKLVRALELSDLLRINGVGPVYAKILKEIGINNVSDYLKTESSDILKKYQEINEKKALSKAKLGIKDVEYCKRFCLKLDQDIE